MILSIRGGTSVQNSSSSSDIINDVLPTPAENKVGKNDYKLEKKMIIFAALSETELIIIVIHEIQKKVDRN